MKRLPRLVRPRLRVGQVRALPKILPAGYAGEVPPPPDGWIGSEPEWLVYWWLTKHKYEFLYQHESEGGRLYLGGLVCDFLVTDRIPELALNVQGEYYHFGSGMLTAKNLLDKIQLMNMGYDVVFLRETDLRERLDFTMYQAMRGIQLYTD